MKVYREKLDKDGKPVLDANGKPEMEEVPESEYENVLGKQTETGKDGFKPITSQEDFDARITGRIDRLKKTIRDDLQKELKDEADREAAAKNGDFKKLYDDLKTKFDDLESEHETEKLTANRERIARKHQIPDDLLDLVRGETDEEIEASVKKLAKHVNPGAVDTEAGSGRKGQAQTTKGAPRQLDDPAPKQDEKQPQYPFVPDGAVVIID